MENNLPPDVAALVEELTARGVLLPESENVSLDAVQALCDALRRARAMLAREQDAEKRAVLRVQVRHLKCKLERAKAGGYDG